MDEKTLYPDGYEEPEPESKSSPARDEAAALAIIRASVPVGGKALTVEQVRKLVCGDQPLYSTAAQGPDPSKDMPGALAALAAGQPIVGPAATASFLPHEVDAFILRVIAERRPSWKEQVPKEVKEEKVK